MGSMIGKTISHYKILEKLGSGGRGVVYKAKDTKLKRIVALKFLPPELTRDQAAKQRFINEAQAASALDHPNICNIHEIDETEDGQLFICMSCYEGETLKKRIDKGSLKMEEAVNVAIQVAQGLTKAHKQGIVHRDIKPANIFITEDGQVKILDFGLAKLAGQTSITKIGATVGTVAYMSPEQAHGEGLDHRTDIWSLGVVLYEMLTGQLPFKGENFETVIYSIFNEEPQSIKQLQEDVPLPLQQAVQKMMQKEVRERYKDTSTVITDLKSLGLKSDYAIPLQPFSVKIVKKALKKKSIQKILIPVFILAVFVISFFLTRTILFSTAVAVKRKPIAVMIFKNLTGESNFDYLSEAIPNLLITNLEQSADLQVMTWERMHDLLKTLGKEDAEIIDTDLGFELCRMDDIETIILGSFTRAGDIFATDVKVLDVETKELLQSASSRGEGIASILERQIDELSIDIFRGIGISEEEMAVAQPRITEVTTSSMDAYNYFLRGRTDLEKRYYDDARRFLEKAVGLDSTFASAYLYLARTYGNLRYDNAMKEAYEKAKTFSQEATEKERLYIEAAYASDIEKNPKKSFLVLKEIAKRYPKEKRVHCDLAFYYRIKELFDEAVEEFDRALKLDPNYGEAMNGLASSYAEMGEYNAAIEYFGRYASVSPGDANPFDSMGDLYFAMGKLDEAIAKYKEALEVKPDFGAEWKIAYVYALKENYPQAMRWLDQFITMAPSTGIKGLGHSWRAFYHGWLGSFDKSQSALDKAVEMWKSSGLHWAQGVGWGSGWLSYYRGEFELSRRHFKQWHDFIVQHDPSKAPWRTALYNYSLGLVDLKQGRVDSARSRLYKMKSILPEIRPEARDWISFRHDLLYGEILLREDSLEKAVHICENVSPSEREPGRMSSHEDMLGYNLDVFRDVLARAYQRNGDLNKAIAEYEMLITFDPKSQERRLVDPRYHYRLAKLYEEKGQKTKAIAQYEKFLEIWKDADEDLPEFVDTRERLKNLLGEMNRRES